MIRILDKYIAKHVIMGIGLMLAVVVGLDLIFSFLPELDNLKGDYKALNALRYVTYSIPGHLYYYMPVTVLVGCLLGLGVMADHRELTVMRAAGVSIGRISFAVMLPVFIILSLNMGMSEYPAPQLQQIVETERAILRSGEDFVSTQQGYWRREGNSYIHFNAADPHGKLYGVTSYNFDDSRHLQKVLFAKNADFIFADNHWVLYSVQEVTFTPTGSHLEQYPSQAWDITLSPTVLKTLVLNPSSQSISDLRHFIAYFSQQGLSVNQYLLAYWNKVLQPLSIISLVLISLSFVFGSLRSSTMGFRIFCGAIVGLVFEFSQDMLGSVSLVYGLPPLMATIIPIIFCAGIGAYLLRKVG